MADFETIPDTKDQEFNILVVITLFIEYIMMACSMILHGLFDLDQYIKLQLQNSHKIINIIILLTIITLLFGVLFKIKIQK